MGGAPRPGRPTRASSTGRPIMALLDLLGRRWALRVLWELHHAPGQTFRQLQDACGGISSSVLNSRIGELTEAAIIRRTDEGYVLTDEGRELVTALNAMNAWADRWAARTDARER